MDPTAWVILVFVVVAAVFWASLEFSVRIEERRAASATDPYEGIHSAPEDLPTRSRRYQ